MTGLRLVRVEWLTVQGSGSGGKAKKESIKESVPEMYRQGRF